MSGQQSATKEHLSNDLKVACEIYRLNLLKEPAYFSKIVENLKDVMSKLEVSHSFDVLADWSVIRSHYDSIGNGRAGRVHFIDEDSVYMIKPLYEKHWRTRNA